MKKNNQKTHTNSLNFHFVFQPNNWNKCNFWHSIVCCYLIVLDRWDPQIRCCFTHECAVCVCFKSFQIWLFILFSWTLSHLTWGSFFWFVLFCCATSLCSIYRIGSNIVHIIDVLAVCVRVYSFVHCVTVFVYNINCSMRWLFVWLTGWMAVCVCVQVSFIYSMVYDFVFDEWMKESKIRLIIHILIIIIIYISPNIRTHTIVFFFYARTK